MSFLNFELRNAALIKYIMPLQDNSMVKKINSINSIRDEAKLIEKRKNKIKNNRK